MREIILIIHQESQDDNISSLGVNTEFKNIQELILDPELLAVSVSSFLYTCVLYLE